MVWFHTMTWQSKIMKPLDIANMQLSVTVCYIHIMLQKREARLCKDWTRHINNNVMILYSGNRMLTVLVVLYSLFTGRCPEFPIGMNTVVFSHAVFHRKAVRSYSLVHVYSFNGGKRREQLCNNFTISRRPRRVKLINVSLNFRPHLFKAGTKVWLKEMQD